MSGYPRRGSLTDEQVLRIREDYARGYRSANQLSKEYGKNAATIQMVVQGATYKYVGGPITWPDYCNQNHRPLPDGAIRGRCRDSAGCNNPIATEGRARFMHLCQRCFEIQKAATNAFGKGARKELRLRCRACRRWFQRVLTPGEYKPRYCSDVCVAKGVASQKVKRPKELSDELLGELYWGQDKTTREIAARFGSGFSPSAVRLWLIAANIPLRRAGSRTYTRCVVDGCGADIHKLFNGERWYGRLCKKHLTERDMRRRHFYEDQMYQQRGSELAVSIRRLLIGLPESVKQDAEADIMVAVLSGEIAAPLTHENTKPYIVKVFKENANAWKFISIAASAPGGEGTQTWGERLGLS